MFIILDYSRVEVAIKNTNMKNIQVIVLGKNLVYR